MITKSLHLVIILISFLTTNVNAAASILSLRNVRL